ncbi:FecR domain-containing protein [Isoalcanivorax beigongshangi]|uniref:FecR domain-containing protein n=1 Tax=Isoalcanivorax beigongshangi TaxID=3238810 RepID=A0ABV4AIR6_9GAMM
MSAQTTVLPRQALSDAAHWHVLFCSGDATDADHRAWQQWLAADSHHQQAWQALEQLQQQFRALPPRLARNTLGHAQLQRPAINRRSALKALALLTVTAGLGWSAREQLLWRGDYHTAMGEQRQLLLPDGSQLTLNTDSAVDVHYNGTERRLSLRRGEIHIRTVADPQQRPFLVDTVAGRLQALGTRFLVRQQDHNQVRVTVLESAVQVQPAIASTPLILNRGQQVLFSAHHLGTPQTTDELAAAWTRGTLIAVDWRLDDLLSELGRYRPGWLLCDPAVAAFRVSGAFPLHDIDQALTSLEQSFPVQLERRTRYWLRVRARS